MRSNAIIQEMGERYTPFGVAMYLRIQRHDGKTMTWKQLYNKFTDAYPGKWGIQMLPPRSELVDEANIYHIFLFQEEAPEGLNINSKSFGTIVMFGGSPYISEQRISIHEFANKQTPFGPTTYLVMFRQDGKPMKWKELYKRFSEAFPEKWGIQMLPPKSELIDNMNWYHIFLFHEEAPQGLNIRRRLY